MPLVLHLERAVKIGERLGAIVAILVEATVGAMAPMDKGPAMPRAEAQT